LYLNILKHAIKVGQNSGGDDVSLCPGRDIQVVIHPCGIR